MPLSQERIAQLDTFVRAANFLGAAQIYLRDNTRLAAPLKPEHIKHRLLGHWGTQPGLNLLYAHLSRLIQDTDAEMMLMIGPGHGAPAILGCLWLEATLGEIYPEYRRDAAGMAHLIHAFSWPNGFPSHLTALTPGAIHEGGELGYSLVHAFGAALDNPDLIVACVVGDGEAETGPLAGSWHSTKFIDPSRDGTVLPILHLNGVKLSGPTLYARMTSDELAAYMRGCGWIMREVAGDSPAAVHAPLAEALDWAHAEITRLRARARGNSAPELRRLADDRAAHAQGHDGARRRSTASRWSAPSAATRCPITDPAHQPGAPRDPRNLAAQLPPAGAVRRRGRSRRRRSPPCCRGRNARWAARRTPMAGC